MSGPAGFPQFPTADLEDRLWRDPWLVMSALQKSIRRGEVDIAERASLALYRLRGAGSVARRLMVIAVEDIGIAAPALVAERITIATEAIRSKRPSGPDRLIETAERLARAVKDRSSDYLASIVSMHPDLELLRERLGSMSISQRLAVVADDRLTVEERCCAVWYTSGLDVGDERRLDRGDRPALMRTFIDLGIPKQFVTAADMASTITREPICCFLPLLWLVSRDGPSSVEHPVLRPSPLVGGLPLYALGMHTRSGRQAIAAFCHIAPIREVIERWVPAYRAREVGLVSEFHADGGMTTPRLQWPEGQRLGRLAIETDLTNAGAAREGVEPILKAFADNIDLLDALRARLLTQKFGGETH